MGAATEGARDEGKSPKKRLHSTGWVAALAIALAVITAVVYCRSLNYPFVFDDHHAILDNDDLQNVSNLLRSFTDPDIFSDQPGRAMYRPLVTASYILNWAIFEDKSAGWRILNMAFHVGAGLFLFLLLDLFTSRRSISALIAVAFIAHPAATEAAVFMSARSTLMAAAFVLVSMYCFTRWSIENRGVVMIAVSLVAFAMGLLCKENVVMLAIVFPVIYWAVADRTLKATFSLRASAAYVAPIIIAASFMALRKWGFDLDTAVLKRRSRTEIEQLLTQSGVWWRYFGTMLWPIWLNVYRYIEIVPSVTRSGAGLFAQPIVWIGGWVAMAMLVVINYRNRMALLGGFFAAVILIPETVTALNLLSADRRLYMPLIGIAMIVASVFRRGREIEPKYAKVWIACLVAAIACYIPLSYIRIGEWRTEKSLFESTIRNTPMSHVAWHGLGYVYGQRQEFKSAIVCLNQALSIKPSYAASLRLLGAIYLKQGRLKEALPILGRAVRYEPLAQRGWYNLGVAQMMTGQIFRAERSLMKAIEQDPHYTQAYNILGLINERMGKLDQAALYFETATALDRNNEEYSNNLNRVRRKLLRPEDFPETPVRNVP